MSAPYGYSQELVLNNDSNVASMLKNNGEHAAWNNRELNGLDVYSGIETEKTVSIEATLGIKKNPVDVYLKYKKGWTDEQKAAADAKLKICSEADTVKSEVIRGNQKKLRSQLKKTLGIKKIPEGYDVDHVVDLQIGGRDDMMNTQLLDRSVNRSLGAQIQHAIKDYEIGTPLGEFTIK